MKHEPLTKKDLQIILSVLDDHAEWLFESVKDKKEYYKIAKLAGKVSKLL